MDKKKKEIRIIKSDFNKEDYTFVSKDNILNHTKNNESIINAIKSWTKLNNRIEKSWLKRGREIGLKFHNYISPTK